MCSILAFKGKSSLNNIELISNFIVENSIRGKHATGVSYLFDNKIKTLIEPTDGKSFLEKHFSTIKQDLLSSELISLIGHSRYSTSGLEHNQPIDIGNNLSVAMNGVLTQADPKYWKELYDIEPVTTNDAEIIHNYLQKGINVIQRFPRASMAVVGLWKHGKMFSFRNSTRPAWSCQRDDSIIVSSTQEVFKRSGINENLIQLNAGELYILSESDFSLVSSYSVDIGIDYQNIRL